MMKLSVCCITHNHELFIAAAIKSFLKQKTNFEYEIVIANDASTDSTHEIIEHFRKEYPKIIRYYNHDKNIGMIPNLKLALQACSEKYIALCEGDDYWTDDYKLQEQVDFLEKHSAYVGCFHNTEERYEGDDKAFIKSKS